MIDIEKNVDWPLTTTDRHLVAFEYSREGRQSLLPVEQKFATRERSASLIDSHLTSGNLLLSLPYEDRAAGIAPVERIEQVAHSWTTPDIATLNLWKLKLAAFDHTHQRSNANVLLLHREMLQEGR